MDLKVVVVCFVVALLELVNSQCAPPIGTKLTCCKEKKDIGCFAVVPNPNQTKSNQREEICYCDRHCHLTHDCCPDAALAIRMCRPNKGPKNCTVSEWSAWGGCSKQCGIGKKIRKRQLVKPAENGGSCPSLKQSRGCNSENSRFCKKKKKAYILPVSYRRPNLGQFLYEKILPAPAIRVPRSSQRSVYGMPGFIEKDPNYSYCVTFKVYFASNGCRHALRDQGRPVCVECQSRAISKTGKCRGQGQIGHRSRWEILGDPKCFGVWLRLGPVIKNCSCNFKQFYNYVFV